MASRILTKENACDKGRCREMFSYPNSAIRYHSYKLFNQLFHGADDIEPIIAKGNRFDKIKAKW